MYLIMVCLCFDLCDFIQALFRCLFSQYTNCSVCLCTKEICLCVFVPAVGPLIGRYCGTKIPPEIQSSTGLLSLTFHTDMAVAKDGFSARYNMTYREVSDSE